MTTTTETKKPGFCWRNKDSETAEGTFPTREEAIADARAYDKGCGAGFVIISSVVWIRVRDFIGVEQVLDNAIECFSDSYSVDDTPFAIARGVTNEEAQAALEAWAEKYLTSNVEWCWGDDEEVVDARTQVLRCFEMGAPLYFTHFEEAGGLPCFVGDATKARRFYFGDNEDEMHAIANRTGTEVISLEDACY